jgi:hypothetical protein
MIMGITKEQWCYGCKKLAKANAVRNRGWEFYLAYVEADEARIEAEARIEKYADFLRLKDRNYERLEARLVAAEQRHIEPMAGCSCSACTQLRERGRS